MRYDSKRMTCDDRLWQKIKMAGYKVKPQWASSTWVGNGNLPVNSCEGALTKKTLFDRCVVWWCQCV